MPKWAVLRANKLFSCQALVGLWGIWRAKSEYLKFFLLAQFGVNRKSNSFLKIVEKTFEANCRQFLDWFLPGLWYFQNDFWKVSVAAFENLVSFIKHFWDNFFGAVGDRFWDFRHFFVIFYRFWLFSKQFFKEGFIRSAIRFWDTFYSGFAHYVTKCLKFFLLAQLGVNRRKRIE